MTYCDTTSPETVKRYRFAKLLGEELRRKKLPKPGTWAHMEALQAAWDKAERRARGGL